ncbi:MAG: hypothetical protein GX358_03070 [candidate division WS1 bacterium]|nr:hypothetical protein [candidate division WS1 bacterium]
MRCPFCQQNIRIQGRFCPQCGEQIFGLPVRRPDSEPGESPQPGQTAPPVTPRPAIAPPGQRSEAPWEDLDADFGAQQRPVSGSGRPQAADAQFVGKTCPYCRFPIKPDDQIVVCPACQVPHHADCWQENQGCTTYGCTSGAPGNAPPSWAVPRPPSPTPPAGAPHPTGAPSMSPDARRRMELTFAQMQAQELSTQATNALVLAVLGILCFLPAMVGFFMALSVIGRLGRIPSLTNHPARARAIWAIVISLLFMLIWVVILFGTGVA